MVSLKYGAGTSPRSPGFDLCMAPLLWTAWILNPLVFGHCRHVLPGLSSAGSSLPQTASTSFLFMSLHIFPSDSLFTFRPWSSLCPTFWSWFAHLIIAHAAFIMSQILKTDRRFRTEGTSRCQCFLGHYSRGSLEGGPKEPEKGDGVLVC